MDYNPRRRQEKRGRGYSGRLDRREEEEEKKRRRSRQKRYGREEEEEEEGRRARAAEMIPSKVCAIISKSVYHELFLLDLDKDKGCDGDEVLVSKEPNFLINGVPFGCYCGLNGSIYMFDGVSYLDDVSSECGKNLNGVYRLNLWPGMSHYTNCAMDRSTLSFMCRMDSPKVRPAAMRFRGGIVVFSTLIPYYNTKPPYPYYITKPPSPDACDFEILTHDLRSSGPTTHPLPQLRIRLVASESWRWFKPDCYFLLLSPSSETEGERVMPRYSCRRDELRRPSFRIVSFSVIEQHKLVVQTDFAGLFCLDLDVPCAEWKVFDGPLFPLAYENFVAQDSDIVLCASGASKFSNARGYGGVDVSFPVSSSFYPNESWRNFAMGLPERSTYPKCFPCVLHTDQPKWILDILRVDLSKFRVNEEEQDMVDVRFARRIKSFRFIAKSYGISFTPMLVYPFSS